MAGWQRVRAEAEGPGLDEIWKDFGEINCVFCLIVALFVMMQIFRTIQHLQKKQSQTVEEQGSRWHNTCSGNVDACILFSHDEYVWQKGRVYVVRAILIHKSTQSCTCIFVCICTHS